MLIPAGRKKMLEVFLKDPFKEIHLRELARLSTSSLTNVNNSMCLFVKNNMFIRNEVARATFFKPDLANDETIKLFEFLEIERRNAFYSKNKAIARLLRKYTDTSVDRSNKRIQMVILFGSVARGEWTKDSDIDILAVVADKENEIINILNKSRAETGSFLEINPVCTTIKKFQESMKNKAEFYDNLWDDRVVLYNEFLFWQLVREGRSNASQY
ncbi:MAG: nucleotidyltransferase domain-containing protein [Candidatus Omnitrophota bacterium]